MMFNNETKEIAKPTELLNSIKAIMNVLQSIENYGITDTTHLHFRSTDTTQLHITSRLKMSASNLANRPSNNTPRSQHPDK